MGEYNMKNVRLTVGDVEIGSGAIAFNVKIEVPSFGFTILLTDEEWGETYDEMRLRLAKQWCEANFEDPPLEYPRFVISEGCCHSSELEVVFEGEDYGEIYSGNAAWHDPWIDGRVQRRTGLWVEFFVDDWDCERGYLVLIPSPNRKARRAHLQAKRLRKSGRKA